MAPAEAVQGTWGMLRRWKQGALKTIAAIVERAFKVNAEAVGNDSCGKEPWPDLERE